MKTNLIGRFGIAEIWDGRHTPVEIVAALINTHYEKCPGVDLLVCATETDPSGRHADMGKLYKVSSNRCRLNPN